MKTAKQIENWLKAQDWYPQFEKNVKELASEETRGLLSGDAASNTICCAFWWDESEEGFEYWEARHYEFTEWYFKEDKIKFRAKRRADGVWVYGTPVYGTNDKCYMVHGATEDAVNSKNEVDFYFSEVDPDTIGQYTGLKDKNGKEIYEGDIVKTVNWETPILAVVIFSEGLFRIKDPSFSSSFEIDRYRLEVIGNRWDNPELLRTKNHE